MLAGVLGFAVLVGAASCATKDAKQEQKAPSQAARAESREDFWLGRLEKSGTFEDKELAAEKLAAMGSARAFPRILEAWLASPRGRKVRDCCLLAGVAAEIGAAAADHTGPDAASLAEFDSHVETMTVELLTWDDPLVSSLRAILRQTRGRAVPEVTAALEHKDSVARLLTLSLVVSGPDPRPYRDDVAACARDPDPAVRGAAGEALEKIQEKAP